MIEQMQNHPLITLFLLIQFSTSWATSWPEPIFVEIAKNLAQPVHITHAGDTSGRLFIVEQPGRIKILQDNMILKLPFLDISQRVRTSGERGLFSVAFPPNYSNKGYFYVNYTNKAGNTTVSRFYLGSGANDANEQSEEIILTIAQPFVNHNGGQIAFGSDGFLYIGTGDGGSGGDPLNSGQSGNTLLGKMLRIDVESGVKPYAIPDTNPFLSTTGFRPEIWALGLRNPWRFAFDRKTGDLYIADVGQDLFEEVNVQPANSRGGENYGWNTMEGLHCFESAVCDQSGLTRPVLEYSHTFGDVSISGGHVYRGDEFPRMFGLYFFADFASGRVAAMRRANNQWETSVLADTDFNISSFGENEAGQLYLADLNGSIYHIKDKISLSRIEFSGLLPRYQPGDNLQIFIQETTVNRSFPTDLWVALQPPNGPLLFLTGAADQPFSRQPQAFNQQLDNNTTRHNVLDLTIPLGSNAGTYTFYAIYNQPDADISELSLTRRSGIAQAMTVVDN